MTLVAFRVEQAVPACVHAYAHSPHAGDVVLKHEASQPTADCVRVQWDPPVAQGYLSHTLATNLSISAACFSGCFLTRSQTELLQISLPSGCSCAPLVTERSARGPEGAPLSFFCVSSCGAPSRGWLEAQGRTLRPAAPVTSHAPAAGRRT